MKKVIGYVVGIFILSTVLGYMLSLALSILPYLGVASAFVLPVYGLVRQKKQWVVEHAGVGKWIKEVASHLKFAKRSLTFYLILGMALRFIYEDVAMLFARTVGCALGAALILMVVWNCVSIVLKKNWNIEITSYQKALKNSW